MGEEIVTRAVGLAEPASLPSGPLHVLKHDDLFAVFNASGDFFGQLHPVGPNTGADGLFHDDTRVLSRLMLSIASGTPQLLAGAIGADNVLFTAHLTNPLLSDRTGAIIPPGQIDIHRRRFLWNGNLYEVLQVTNFFDASFATELVIEVDADFRDVFEIRGATRSRRGELLPVYSKNNSLILSYRGLDGCLRRTAVSFSVPIRVEGKSVAVPLALASGQRQGFLMTVSCAGDDRAADTSSFITALKRSKKSARRSIREFNPIETSNTAFDSWLQRAAADLSLLVTELDSGPYPYAGIPWFSAPFGRDAIVTAMQLLWVEPSLARGVLAYLSVLQAADESTFHDSEPGKIMHELRKGEMAALREVPFGRYYGGVDTTPLFVMLAGAYLKRTDDIEFITRIWPAVAAALGWMDNFGDADQDGFIEYRRGLEGGLTNQGWKDSVDSIFHADGRLAHGAIAVVEVQAYAVAAKEAASRIAARIGEEYTAGKLLSQAHDLRRRIDERFWCDSIGTYSLALDGNKRPCSVRSSNAGHVLFCGAADPKKAIKVARQLMSREMFSGWGVRTIAATESRYNPMSYHNGTIWPHDCSIVAAGLAHYGLRESSARILTGLFEAICRFPEFRMPELFCGFRRRAGEGPVSFPSACTPQAWASGAVFLLLQSCLGLEIDANAKTISVKQPHLPPWLERIVVRDLSVGGAQATLHFSRSGEDVSVRMSGETGELRLAVA